MATSFSPLVLPSQLHDFPQEYNQRIKLYDDEGNVSDQKNLDWFNNFVDLEEVYYEDEKNEVVCTKSCKRSQKMV
jgi:hypothetical protein